MPSLQEYASRLDLGTFTFPEPGPLASANDDDSDEADHSSKYGEGADDHGSKLVRTARMSLGQSCFETIPRGPNKSPSGKIRTCH